MTRRQRQSDASEAILALAQYRTWIHSRGRRGYISTDGQAYARAIKP